MQEAKQALLQSPTIRVIHGKGSDLEIGRQHAEQLTDQASQGMLHFYIDFWNRMSGRVPSGFRERWVMSALRVVTDRYIRRNLESQIAPFIRDRLSGMSQVLSFSSSELALAAVLPDVLSLLQTYYANWYPRGVIPVSFPQFGCSSFLAKGNQFLVGRNLDFPGVGYWDRYAVIQSVDQPGKLKYVGFTSAGVPLCGITGINEAQIMVSIHQHYCRVGTVHGGLPYVVGEEILATAKNLNDARRVLAKAKLAATWAFVVADGKAQDGFIYEIHPKASGINELPKGTGVLTHTNFFQTKQCQPEEYATTARMNWDNLARKSRLESLVRDHQWELSPQIGVQFLSDHYDPYWGEEKIHNRVVSQVYNIQSILFDPANMRVYVAEGESPIHLRKYAEFDLTAIFEGGDGRTGVNYPGYKFHFANKLQAKEDYIRAFVAAMDDNYERSEAFIDESLNYDFCPETAFTAAVLKLKLGQFEQALELLIKAKETIEGKVSAQGKKVLPPEYFEILIFAARTYDLLGRRRSAIAYYQMLADFPGVQDPHILHIARTQGPYKRSDLDKIFTPFGSYIPFQ